VKLEIPVSLENQMKQAHTLKRPSANTPNIYETENVKDSKDYLVVAHYFLPSTNVDYYVIEYDKEADEIYCWAELIPNCGELGYSSMREIEMIEISIPIKSGNILIGYLPVRIEYDNYWQPRRLGKVLEERRK
jgi:hypothetical protein